MVQRSYPPPPADVVLRQLADRIAWLEKQAPGNQAASIKFGEITDGGAINFGSKVGQLINLFGTRRLKDSASTEIYDSGANETYEGVTARYGIGVQNSTAYVRTDRNFAVFVDGEHSNQELSAGSTGENVFYVRKFGGDTTTFVRSLANATLHIEADTDNADESHVATLILSQDGGVVEARIGTDSSNEFYVQFQGSDRIRLGSQLVQLLNAASIVDGTVAAPAIRFASDTNTGIYRFSADQLAITCGGANAMIATDGGGTPTINTAGPATGTTSGFQYVMRSTTFGTLFRFTSTAEVKERIKRLRGSGEIIDQLNPVTFVEKKRSARETSDEKKARLANVEYGLIAEEVAQVADGKLAQYEWTEEGELRPVGWNWPGMISVLIAEVQQLRQRVADLEHARQGS